MRYGVLPGMTTYLPLPLVIVEYYTAVTMGMGVHHSSREKGRSGGEPAAGGDLALNNYEVVLLREDAEGFTFSMGLVFNYYFRECT